MLHVIATVTTPGSRSPALSEYPEKRGRIPSEEPTPCRTLYRSWTRDFPSSSPTFPPLHPLSRLALFQREFKYQGMRIYFSTMPWPHRSVKFAANGLGIWNEHSDLCTLAADPVLKQEQKKVETILSWTRAYIIYYGLKLPLTLKAKPNFVWVSNITI